MVQGLNYLIITRRQDTRRLRRTVLPRYVEQDIQRALGVLLDSGRITAYVTASADGLTMLVEHTYNSIRDFADAVNNTLSLRVRGLIRLSVRGTPGTNWATFTRGTQRLDVATDEHGPPDSQLVAYVRGLRARMFNNRQNSWLPIVDGVMSSQEAAFNRWAISNEQMMIPILVNPNNGQAGVSNVGVIARALQQFNRRRNIQSVSLALSRAGAPGTIWAATPFTDVPHPGVGNRRRLHRLAHGANEHVFIAFVEQLLDHLVDIFQLNVADAHVGGSDPPENIDFPQGIVPTHEELCGHITFLLRPVGVGGGVQRQQVGSETIIRSRVDWIRRCKPTRVYHNFTIEINEVLSNGLGELSCGLVCLEWAAGKKFPSDRRELLKKDKEHILPMECVFDEVEKLVGYGTAEAKKLHSLLGVRLNHRGDAVTGVRYREEVKLPAKELKREGLLLWRRHYMWVSLLVSIKQPDGSTSMIDETTELQETIAHSDDSANRLAEVIKEYPNKSLITGAYDLETRPLLKDSSSLIDYGVTVLVPTVACLSVRSEKGSMTTHTFLTDPRKIEQEGVRRLREQMASEEADREDTQDGGGGAEAPPEPYWCKRLRLAEEEIEISQEPGPSNRPPPQLSMSNSARRKRADRAKVAEACKSHQQYLRISWAHIYSTSKFIATYKLLAALQACGGKKRGITLVLYAHFGAGN